MRFTASAFQFCHTHHVMIIFVCIYKNSHYIFQSWYVSTFCIPGISANEFINYVLLTCYYKPVLLTCYYKPVLLTCYHKPVLLTCYHKPVHQPYGHGLNFQFQGGRKGQAWELQKTVCQLPRVLHSRIRLHFDVQSISLRPDVESPKFPCYTLAQFYCRTLS